MAGQTPQFTPNVVCPTAVQPNLNGSYPTLTQVPPNMQNQANIAYMRTAQFHPQAHHFYAGPHAGENCRTNSPWPFCIYSVRLVLRKISVRS